METERNEQIIYPEDLDTLPDWGWHEHRFLLVGIYAEDQKFMALPEVIPPEGWHLGTTFQFRDRVYTRITKDVLREDASETMKRVYARAMRWLDRMFEQYGPDAGDEIERQQREAELRAMHSIDARRERGLREYWASEPVAAV